MEGFPSFFRSLLPISYSNHASLISFREDNFIRRKWKQIERQIEREVLELPSKTRGPISGKLPVYLIKMLKNHSEINRVKHLCLLVVNCPLAKPNSCASK